MQARYTWLSSKEAYLLIIEWLAVLGVFTVTYEDGEQHAEGVKERESRATHRRAGASAGTKLQHP